MSHICTERAFFLTLLQAVTCNTEQKNRFKRSLVVQLFCIRQYKRRRVTIRHHDKFIWLPNTRAKRPARNTREIRQNSWRNRGTLFYILEFSTLYCVCSTHVRVDPRILGSGARIRAKYAKKIYADPHIGYTLTVQCAKHLHHIYAMQGHYVHSTRGSAYFGVFFPPLMALDRRPMSLLWGPNLFSSFFWWGMLLYDEQSCNMLQWDDMRRCCAAYWCRRRHSLLNCRHECPSRIQSKCSRTSRNCCSPEPASYQRFSSEKDHHGVSSTLRSPTCAGCTAGKHYHHYCTVVFSTFRTLESRWYSRDIVYPCLKMRGKEQASHVGLFLEVSKGPESGK
jgi:hypothetical protein